MKLLVNCGEPLSNFAFKFDLRRYTKGLIDYIVDDNPLKQGLYSPGLHIPVVESTRFYEDRPDYILILAWNFAAGTYQYLCITSPFTSSGYIGPVML